MKETKYVVIRMPLADTIFMFPSSMDHADVAGRLTANKDDVLSAGFIRLTHTGKWHCYGKSIGLDMRARPVDSEIANRQYPTMEDD